MEQHARARRRGCEYIPKGYPKGEAMETVSNLILIDSDAPRRAAVAHALSEEGMHVQTLDSISELAECWPRSGAILLHEQPGGVAALISLMARQAEWLPIVAFAEKPSCQRVVQAILDGAVDFVTWPFAAKELRLALDRAATLVDHPGRARVKRIMARTRVERLTCREREVLGGVASGLSNRLIGEKLSISPRTVEIHRANLLNKLEANHTSDAIRIACEAALIA
jgi:two-component system response regulator FixJ